MAGVVAGLLLAGVSPAVAEKATFAGVGIHEPEGDSCFRSWEEGGRIDDGCSMALTIGITTNPLVAGRGTLFDQTGELDFGAVVAAAESERGAQITVPSIAYGGTYSGRGPMSGPGGKNDKSMFQAGLTGLDRYEGTITVTTFTPRLLEGSYTGTLYRMPGGQLVSTAISGEFTIPLPARADPRRPPGVTRQEAFRMGYNLLHEMAGKLRMARELAGAGGGAGGGGGGGRPAAGAPPCDCSCSALERARVWQVGRACEPRCAPPDWRGRDCFVGCGEAWEACPQAAPSADLDAETRRLVELLAAQQGATTELELRSIEAIVEQLTPEQRRMMIETLE
ncbi:MAG: hypothetical protein R3190_11855 [Thermoanaerobaculia bacterium]|nr:hypothetical protein [Thermoanaerobaculia bacterium]